MQTSLDELSKIFGFCTNFSFEFSSVLEQKKQAMRDIVFVVDQSASADVNALGK